MALFDLGGVLVRINHFWEQAAAQAGIAATFGVDGRTLINSFPALEAYQMGAIDLEGYLARLAEWSGVTRDQALAIHNAILIGEYPGVPELIEDLKAAGIWTGCLSNTNGPHWMELLHFRGIALLDRRMASHEVGLSKPDPAIYHLCAEANGVEPSDIVFFDDHAGNVASAAEVGYRAFQVDPDGEPATQMRAILVELGVL